MQLSRKGGGEATTRAGVLVLSLFSVPLNVVVLDLLADGPKSMLEIRGVSSAPATTVRRHMRSLIDLGAVERRREGGFPGSTTYRLTRSGEDLMGVAATVRAWLELSPDGPLELGDTAAKSVIKALTDAWGTSMLRALAARPLSLTELDLLITTISYPSLERRLAALRLNGLVRREPGPGGGTPHAVTNWLRQAVAPLAAAARWESVYARGAASPITNRDIEAAFLLGLPLLRLPADVSGSCRLAVEFSRNGNGPRYAGVVVGVIDGEVASCVSHLQQPAVGWASGSVADWMGAVIAGDQGRLQIGGEAQLPARLLDGLHATLFSRRARPGRSR
jgi:DNA-binding HxlR family transcriptional regulator